MRQLSPDEELILHRVLEDLLHRFVVFDGMQLSEGTEDTAFTLDTCEDRQKVQLAMRLLGFDARKGVPPGLREQHAHLKHRDPALAACIEQLAAEEAARIRPPD